MEKKKIIHASYGCMVGIIFLIFIGGLFLVEYQRGWFSHAEEGSVSLASQVTGTTQMTRNGIAYPVEEGTQLRDQDQLVSQSDATLTIQILEAWLTMNEETLLTVDTTNTSSFSASISEGEIFLCVPEGITLSITTPSQTMTLADTVISVSVRTGAETIYVYRGEVVFHEETISSGEYLLFTGEESYLSTFEATTMNEFCLVWAQVALEKVSLCFSDEDFTQVITSRQEEKIAALEAALALEETEEETETSSDEAETSEKTHAVETSLENSLSEEHESTSETSASSSGENQTAVTQETSKASTTTSTASTTTATTAATTAAKKTCTITIRCDTILNNMDNLDSSKEAYVPSSGIILSTTTVEIQDGDTVFDVLKRVCNAAGIQLEYSYTPAYGTYYIEGINHLYEFDCGNESGWMYKVNGWFPNYGCSSYTVADGDVIVWCYTCNGLGADVGA